MPQQTPTPKAPNVREIRAPYPRTLEATREELDYWMNRQGEGQPGSEFEEGVKNRLTNLRNLEQRYLEERRRSDAIRPSTRPDRALEFETAFNSYTAVSQIPVGSGGSGTVYEVNDRDQKTFAIKLLNPQAPTSKAKRFKNELAFCYRNRHKNILTISDYGTLYRRSGETSPFFVMPLYPSTLRKLISGEIPSERVLPLLAQMLDGAEAAHLKGVCHRDLKPENILYDPSKDVLVIADFGIARFKEDDLHTAVETSVKERLASFQYSAPEQRVRGKEVDHRADIFALGLMLNEMFTSEVPQGAGYKPISAAAPAYGFLDSIVERMIQHFPEARYDSIQAIKEELNARNEELNARREDLLNLQRLDAIRNEVVSGTQIDDPLITDPIRLVGIDYFNGILDFKLSQPPNSQWIRQFTNLGSYQFVYGKEPSKFQFIVDVARIPASEQDAELVLNYFKNYLSQANRQYAAAMEASRRQSEQQQRTSLQRRLRNEEERQRILKKLKL